MVKKGLKGKLALKILVPFVLIFVILLTVLTAGNMGFVFEKVESILERKAEYSLHIAAHVYKQHIEEVRSSAERIATAPGLVRAVKTRGRGKMTELLQAGRMKELHALQLLDRRGKIIADASGPGWSGRDLPAVKIVKQVLEGREIIGTAKTESGLLIVAALPVQEGGKVIAMVWVACIFGAHAGEEIETLIKERVFFFIEDAAINPGPLPGQGRELELPAKIKKAVLDKGTNYTHTVFISGKEYSGAASPLVDYDGNIIGLLLVAVDKGPLFEIFNGIVRNALTGSLTGVLVLGLIGFFIARGVTNPARRLMEMTRKVAAGDLSAQVRIRSDDEIGLLAESFDRMVEGLKAARDELLAAKEFSENIINNVPEIIYTRDGNKRITYLSSAAEKILGHPVPAFMEDPGLWERTVHPDDRACLQSLFDSVRKRERYGYEYRIITKDGPLRWVRDRGNPSLDAEGNLKCFYGSVSDITDSKHAEMRLKTFAAKLDQSNRELQDFAYIASHDLQEPLRKVTAFGDRLREKCDNLLDDQGRDYLERMQGAARRMQSLISGILAYSRVTTKTRPFVPVDLSAVVKEVLSDLEVRIEQSNGRVETGDLPVIEADPLQMRQLFQNLVGNALKFTRKGEPPVIQVRSSMLKGSGPGSVPDAPSGGLCRITVQDNGIGFEEKYTDRIFGVFQRLHGRSEYEGTGIGLSVCKKIVERHGGAITAQSAPGQGAAFIITLPVKQPEGGATEGTSYSPE